MRPAHLDRYLQQLVEMGYGPTIREVADYLVWRAIDDLLRAKILTPLTKEDFHKQPSDMGVK